MRTVVIVGATATGKSELALRLAKALGGEIISGDSMQIYRGMDIGTAKPSTEERTEIPHHLIDIADIQEEFSVAVFINKATEAARDITKRGRMPIIVGGTGMYIDLLLSGRILTDMESDERLRRELFERAEREGCERLHDFLRSVDPAAASEIHPNNVKRVVRALEIYHSSGKTKTEQQELSKRGKSMFDYKLLYLTSSSRPFLYDRINERVEKMLAAGLEREARTLYDKGLAQTKTASQAIGYKEFFPLFENKTNIAAVTDEIKKNTRNYAKRQMTYFNRLSDRAELDIYTEGTDRIFKRAHTMCAEPRI